MNNKEIQWPPNPFSAGAPLVEKWFVGRTGQLATLEKALRDGWPRIVVKGPRGIGKTALVQRLLAESDVNGFYVDLRDHLDPRDVRDHEAAERRVAGALMEEIGFRRGSFQGLDAEMASLRLLGRTVLPLLMEGDGRRPVFVLDEVEILEPEVRRRLGHLAARRRAGILPLWVFVVGESWGREVRSPLDLEPVEEVRLGSFEGNELIELLARFPKVGLFEFSGPATEAIAQETAGHPLFVAVLLEAIYDQRWEHRDRSPVEVADVAAALRRLGDRPPARIEHAIRQSGPASQRVLYTLSLEEHESLSEGQLRELFESEWPEWVEEVGSTLDGLRATWLVEEEQGFWSHRIPMLRGLMQRMDRDQVLTASAPPKADAWVAFRAGEKLERQGTVEEAFRAYQNAADLDPAFWLARWHFCRLLLAHPGVLRGSVHENLMVAKEILDDLQVKVATDTVIGRSIRESRRSLLVELARLTLGKDEIEQLEEADRWLETNGAAAVVAEHRVRRWEEVLGRRLSQSWGEGTREILARPFRDDLVWRHLASRVVVWLREETKDDGGRPRPLDLVRYVVPALVESVPDASVARNGLAEVTAYGIALADPPLLWDTLCSWLELSAAHDFEGALEESGPWLPADAWEALLSLPGPFGDRAMAATESRLLGDLKATLTSGQELPGARLVRAVVTRGQSPDGRGEEVLSQLLGWVDSLALDSVGDEARLPDMAAPLARVLLAFGQRGEPTRQTFVELLSEMGGAPSLPEAARTALLELVRATPLEGPADERRKRFQEFLEVSPPREQAAHQELEANERIDLERWLGEGYHIEQRTQVSIPGVPSELDAMRAYEATTKDGSTSRRVFVRRFQLYSPDSETGHLIWSIVDRESRVTRGLSATTAGLSLPRFYGEVRLPDENVALLVTEWVGTQTLRAKIEEAAARGTSLRNETGREKFWTHFLPILKALGILHDAGFLHRAVSPDILYVWPVTDGGASESSGDAWENPPSLRLCHFEWSVYLRALSRRGSYRRVGLNRYSAPEAILAALGGEGASGNFVGENCASDLFSLGLTLFETMVRPFRGESELGLYASIDAYATGEQAKHAEWLDELIREVEATPELEEGEKEFLRKLLVYDVGERPQRIDVLLGAAERLSRPPSLEIYEPLHVFTTLSSQSGGDPRRDHECVAHYLSRELPQVALVGAGSAKDELNPRQLAKIIGQDLRGAEVFFNRRFALDAARSEGHPLLLRSRSGTLYRVGPVRWSPTGAEGEKKEFRHLGYLEVARPREGDEIVGARLAKLANGVEVGNVRNPAEVEERLDDSGASQRLNWHGLFARAAELAPVFEAEMRVARDTAPLARVLELSAEAEYEASWREEVFFAVPGESLRIQSPSGDLAKAVAGWLMHDLHLELVREHRLSLGSGLEFALAPEAVDPEAGVVDLAGARLYREGGRPARRDRLSPEDVPQEGVLRPAANRGTEALYRRRKRMLAELREDSQLLSAITNPGDAAKRRPATYSRPFVEELDESKRTVVDRFCRTEPLLVVQGPPGTGKTTLASEIVLQALAASPSSRILLTAQSHAPLDNLFERLLQERDRNSRVAELLGRVEIIRVPSGAQSEPWDFPEPIRRHLPFERAEQQFDRLRSLSESTAQISGIPARLRAALARQLSEPVAGPDALRRRIEESANLMFVTTNAREIEAALPGSFDLVVVEEAARCLPMELLGVMRLASRWVLIGDHHQLGPFGLLEVLEQVEQRLEASDSVLKEAVTKYLKGGGIFQYLHEAPSRPDLEHASTLKVQWRMHPALASVVSKVFYDFGSVVNPPSPEKEALAKRRGHPFREPPELRQQQLIWVDFDTADRDPACSERRGLGGSPENAAERRTAVAFLRALEATRPTKDVVILSPYRAQVDHFRALLAEHPWFDAVQVGPDQVRTVDSFQGRQAGTVLLSLVRNNTHEWVNAGVGFLKEKRRGTVMFSRAERLLVVFGCIEHFRRFGKDTKWIVEIAEDPATVVIPWTQVLTDSREIRKLEQRY